MAAAGYVLDSDSAPRQICLDWAARSLEFNAPDPLIRPLPHGLSAPIPTIAHSAENDKRTKVHFDAQAPPGEAQMISHTQADARPLNLDTQAAPEGPLVNLDALTPERARLDKTTRLPVAYVSKGAAKMNHMTPGHQF